MKRAQTYQWETLSFESKAEEKGYVSASIRGTSTEPVKFDDFSIQLKSLYSAKLYQENHYYPFGINMKGLESSDKQTLQNKKEHEFQFNAQTEREESFGLFWDETPFRAMDMQLGRFWGVDRLIESYASLTPFHYSLNNPISYNDPTGLFPDLPTGGGLSGFDPFMSNEDRMQNFMSSQSGRPGGFFGGSFTSGKDRATSRTIYDFQGVAHTIDESDLVKGLTLIFYYFHTDTHAGGQFIGTETELGGFGLSADGRVGQDNWFWDSFYKTKAGFGTLMYGYKPAMMGIKSLYSLSALQSVNRITSLKIQSYSATASRGVIKWLEAGIKGYENSILGQSKFLEKLKLGKFGTRNMLWVSLAFGFVEAGGVLYGAYDSERGEVNLNSSDYWKLGGIAGDMAFGAAALAVGMTSPAAPFIVGGAFLWYAGRTVYQNRKEIKAFISEKF